MSMAAPGEMGNSIGNLADSAYLSFLPLVPMSLRSAIAS